MRRFSFSSDQRQEHLSAAHEDLVGFLASKPAPLITLMATEFSPNRNGC